jgi:hypothetical protein
LKKLGSRSGPAPGFSKIPIATVDHLAEALVGRNISLVRRLEYIVKRLAEDDKTQKMSKDAETDKALSKGTVEDGATDVELDEEDDEITADMIWIPSPELEEFMVSENPVETREKQHQLREILMTERMARVDKMPTEKLDDWQNQSSTSFARPRGLRKFKSWLVRCCQWNHVNLCIPAPLATILNYMMYEHLRYIVRASITPTIPTRPNAEKNPFTLLPETLRKEIELRNASGDAVRTESLVT